MGIHEQVALQYKYGISSQSMTTPLSCPEWFYSASKRNGKYIYILPVVSIIEKVIQNNNYREWNKDFGALSLTPALSYHIKITFD